MDPGLERSVHRSVVAFVVAGLAAAAACLALAGAFPSRIGGAAGLAVAVGLALGMGVADKYALRVRIGGERIAMTLGDALVVTAMLVLSPAVAPLVAIAGGLAGQLLVQRAPLKATFNVAHEALSASAAAAAMMALLAMGAPLVVAALPAPLVYALVSHVSVAAIVARVERVSTAVVLRQGMVKWALVGLVLSEATALALGVAVG